MDRESLVTSFAAFCGPDRFRRFVHELNTTCRHKRRLRFWQEQLWGQFAGSIPGRVPASFSEIAEALCLCPIHTRPLKSGAAPVLHGYVGLEPAYAKARENRFPFANTLVLRGCCVGHEEVAVIDYCEMCREEEREWQRAREARRLARKTGRTA